jgi:hypothetical protein
MGGRAELPSIKLRSTSRRRGLRRLSPDLITKATDETATPVTRVGLTFLGTAAFCLLSLGARSARPTPKTVACSLRRHLRALQPLGHTRHLHSRPRAGASCGREVALVQGRCNTSALTLFIK